MTDSRPANTVDTESIELSLIVRNWNGDHSTSSYGFTETNSTPQQRALLIDLVRTWMIMAGRFVA